MLSLKKSGFVLLELSLSLLSMFILISCLTVFLHNLLTLQSNAVDTLFLLTRVSSALEKYDPRAPLQEMQEQGVAVTFCSLRPEPDIPYTIVTAHAHKGATHLSLTTGYAL